VHEFMSLDGVIDAPTWGFDYGFHPRWERRSAPFFNDTTKYVVSSTPTTATWMKIIGPYDPDAIRTLRDEVDGDLYTSGSGTLVQGLDEQVGASTNRPLEGCYPSLWLDENVDHVGDSGRP
jgi:hypothetical protein